MINLNNKQDYKNIVDIFQKNVEKIKRNFKDDRLKIGGNSLIAPNVKIECDELEIRDNVFIGPNVRLIGPKIYIGDNTLIFSNVDIQVKHRLSIGQRNKVSKDCLWRGFEINTGKDLWCNEAVRIGGGGWERESAILTIMDYQHIGCKSEINVCNPVSLEGWGGIGIEVKIFTHGAGQGQSFLKGYSIRQGSVTIGKNVSVNTGAIILPGVTIHEGAIIGASALVNKHIPSRVLAAGIPAKALRYIDDIKDLDIKEQLFTRWFQTTLHATNTNYGFCLKTENAEARYISLNTKTEEWLESDSTVVIILSLNKNLQDAARENGWTFIDLDAQTIRGSTTELSEQIRDALRRVGLILDPVQYSPLPLDAFTLVKRGIERF